MPIIYQMRDTILKWFITINMTFSTYTSTYKYIYSSKKIYNICIQEIVPKTLFSSTKLVKILT